MVNKILLVSYVHDLTHYLSLCIYIYNMATTSKDDPVSNLDIQKPTHGEYK